MLRGAGPWPASPRSFPMLNRRQIIGTFAASLFGQKLSKIEERGKQVVDEALAALGGPAYLAMQDRVENGRSYSFYNDRLTGLSRARISTRYLLRPEPPIPGFFGQRERQSFARKDKQLDDLPYYLYLEDKAFDVTYRGAKELDAEVSGRYRDSTRRNVLYMLRQRLGEQGLIIEHQGSDVVDYQPMEIVNFTDADNVVTTVYFHRSTKFPMKQRFVRRNKARGDNDEELAIFDKYKEVGGGVKWPLVYSRFRNGEKQFEMYADEVKVNTGLTDAYFTLPANIEII